MSNNSKERQISLMDLFARVLKRWQILLVCALAMAIAGGFKSYHDQSVSIENRRKEYSEREVSDQDVETSRNFKENTSESLSHAVDGSMEYMTNSLLKDLSDSCYEASAVIYIETDGADNLRVQETEVRITGGAEVLRYAVPENTKTAGVQKALTEIIMNGIDYTKMAEEMSAADPKYVKELISTEVNGGDLTVRVYSPDKNNAEQLILYILESLNGYQASLQEVYGNFTYKDMYIGTSSAVNPYAAWAYTQTTALNNLVNSQNTLNNITGSLSSMSYNIKISSSRQDSVSYKTAAKKAITYGVVGFAAAFALIALYLILSDKVLSAEEIENRYDVQNAAVLKKGTKDKESAYKEAVKEIGYLSDSENIVLAGDVETEKLKALCDDLNSADKNHTYSVLDEQELPENCSAILVSEVEKSRFAATDSTVRQLKSRKIPVAGSIVM